MKNTLWLPIFHHAVIIQKSNSHIQIPMMGLHQYKIYDGGSICSDIVKILVLVVISFPTEYKQWMTAYMGNSLTTRKP